MPVNVVSFHLKSFSMHVNEKNDQTKFPSRNGLKWRENWPNHFFDIFVIFDI